MPYPIIDESGKIWTNDGAGDISGTDYKFPDGSFLTNSISGSYSVFTVANSSLTLLNLWTIDFWINFPNISTGLYIEQDDGNTFMSLTVSGSSGTPIAWIDFVYFGPEDSYEIYTAYPLTIPILAWNHIAIVRNDTVGLIYVNGVKATQQTGYEPGAISNEYINAPFRIFPWYATANLKMDEFRLSNGIARWTSGFTPPTSRYSMDAYTKILLHFDITAAIAGGWTIQNSNI